MSNLSSLPDFRQRPCGTRGKYVAGKCRCAQCRAANARYYHERQALAKAAAADVTGFAGVGFQLRSSADVPVPQTWTAPDGTKRTRIYKRACPGVHGVPCPRRAHLRKDSSAVCETCRDRLVWNGLVSAAAARQHLRWLSRRGVGRRAVHAACDVANSVLSDVRSGRKKQIRADVERRILAVTPDALADHALVPARPTWKKLRRLLAEGFTKTELARRLGSTAKTPQLQLYASHVTAANALKVDRFYRTIMAGDDDEVRPRGSRRPVGLPLAEYLQ